MVLVLVCLWDGTKESIKESSGEYAPIQGTCISFGHSILMNVFDNSKWCYVLFPPLQTLNVPSPSCPVMTYRVLFLVVVMGGCWEGYMSAKHKMRKRLDTTVITLNRHA